MINNQIIEKVKKTIASRKLFIGGEWAASRNGKKFASFNPANGEVIAELDYADEADVEIAVKSAKSATKVWWTLDADERGRRLHKAISLIQQRETEIAVMDTLDSGRPIYDTLCRDLPRVMRTFEFYAGLPDKIRGASIPVPGSFLNYTKKEPYGVVAAIIPWNYPFSNAVTKVAPAIACGNAVILKPAEQTPISALELGPIFQEAGIPDGLLNIVSGDGRTGAALANHPDVSKIAFTGSTSVGKKLYEAAKYGIKSYTLELGGKSPNIIFSDANLDQATDAALFSAFMNQGQTCTAGTRLFVEEDVYEEFMEILLEKVKSLKIGDPLRMDTQIGAIVSQEQYDRVLSYIQIGKQEAKLAYGGAILSDGEFANGYFVQPTIFTEVNNKHRIAREEVFGPVLSVLRFSDENELIGLANDTEYGLACAIWTGNLEKAHRMANQLEAGLVWINTIHSLSPGSPYGGYKQSGTGLEMGMEAVDQYMKTKTIWLNTGEYVSPWKNA